MPVLLLPRGLASVPAAAAFPAVAIEINFTATSGWTDVTPYYDSGGGRQISISRGSDRVESPVIRYDAGTCQIPLANTDRRFDPTNTAGPYVFGGTIGVKPCVPVRVSATFASITYRLFNGTADSWTLSYDQPSDAVATVACTDGFRQLAVQARTARSSFQGGGEDAGARVTRILNDCGWPSAKRTISAGDATVQPTLLGGTPVGVVPLAVATAGGTQTVNVQNAVSTLAPLDELQLTAETEMGELYVNGNGFLVFRNRHALWTDSRSVTSQATFGDTPTAQAGTAFLTGDASTFEGGTVANWVQAGNGAAPANTTAQAHSGTHSMQMSSSAAGNMQYAHCAAANITTQGMACAAGDKVQAAAWLRSGELTGRACNIGAEFYDAAGTPVGGALRGSDVTNSTTLFNTQVTASVTAPAGAAFCRANIQVKATGGASAVHYADDVTLSVAYELPYADVTPAYDDSTLWNGATIANVGGTLQQAADAISQQLPPDGFGPHVYDSENLIADSDWQALGYAQWIVLASKNPELRFSAITVDPIADPVNLFPQVLGREIGDRITAVRRPPGGGTANIRDVFIRGIQHQFDDSHWLTTWILQDATSLPPQFILDDPVNGVLDTSSLGF